MGVQFIPGVDSRPWLELGSGPLHGAERIERPYKRWPRGWVLVRLGKGHPLALASGDRRRAWLVLHYAGIEIPPGFEVDHIDGDKTNDRRENLRVMRKAAHARRHAVMKRRGPAGRWVA